MCDCDEIESSLPNFRAKADEINDRSELAEVLEQMYFEGYNTGYADRDRQWYKEQDEEHV